MSLPTCFFRPDPADPSRFHPTPLTRGPWDNRAQHGGPPCALLARALDAFENPCVGEAVQGPSDHLPTVVHQPRATLTARLAFALLRPVPIAPLRVTVEPIRLGRSVHRLRATLSTDDGTPVVTAEALRIRRAPTASATVPVPDWPVPSACPPLVFNFFRHAVGYHRGVALRCAAGAWGTTPIGVWGRLSAPLVEGTALTALDTLVALSDAQSGMGIPLDPHRFTFVNPDLTLFFGRDPMPGWVGFDIRSTAGSMGTGLAESALRDGQGALGRAAQTLVVAERTPG
mgnify:FL=1